MDNRNELVCLLDELKRQESIPEDDYIKFNIFLSKSLPRAGGSGIEEEEEKVVDDFKHLIKSTTEYIVKHDREELEQLNEDYDDVQLSTLVQEYLNGSRSAQNVLDYLISDQSEIPKSIQIRYRILVKDIEANKRRVKEILERVNAALEDEKLAETLKSMVREELISEDQYEKLVGKIDDMELTTLAGIIRDTKIGNGMMLLPRAREDLKKLLSKSLSKKEICACLDELLRQKVISISDYNKIKAEMEM